jgi:hypothetical protein
MTLGRVEPPQDALAGPAEADHHRNNWIRTVPGTSWFPMLRLYGPLEAWFDKSWKPGDRQVVTVSARSGVASGGEVAQR